MDSKIKKQWVAALRSGEYVQTTGYLAVVEASETNRVGRCCLGVLCDLAEKAGVVTSVTVPANDGSPGYLEYRSGEFDRNCGALPEGVAKWAGLVTIDGLAKEDPFVLDRGLTRSLSDLNDGYGLSFEQIADLIEASL